MKHKVRIFEVDRTGRPDIKPQEHEPIEIDAGTLALAREEALRALLDAGWHVRSLSHLVDGGLIAYVIKPEQPAKRKQKPTRRKDRSARK